MYSLIEATLAVAATWCVLACIFFGVGRLVARVACGDRFDLRQSHLSFWIGWAAIVIFLQLWHLSYPIDARCLLGVMVVGLVGMAFEWRLISSQARKWLARRDRRLIFGGALIALLVTIWCANLSIGAVHRSDTGLYHIQAVRWASSFPIVPGLGNLHGRLAFNNSSFLYAAMLDVGAWSHKSHHLAHGLPTIALLLYLLSAIPKACRRSTTNWPCYLFRAMLFPIAILYSYKEVSSYEPGTITFLLGIVISSLLFDVLYDQYISESRMRLNVFAICLLSSVGLTVKLSFLPFAVTASVIALCLSWKRAGVLSKPFQNTAGWRAIAVCCCAALLAIVPWMVRGVILSGYPVFPSTALAMNVDWRVPLEDAESWRLAVVGYARQHGTEFGEAIGNLGWVKQWAAREFGDVVGVTLPLLFGVVALAGLLLSHRSRRDDWRVAPFWAMLPSVLTILFVLFTAPCSRFAGAAIWVLGMGSVVLFLDRLSKSSDAFNRGFRVAIAMASLLLVLGVFKASRYANGPDGSTAFRPIPAIPPVREITNHGLGIFVAHEGSSWDSPLPSTPCFNPGLALRRHDDLASGFVIRSVQGQPPVDVATDAQRVLK